jgi:hypothetical protein
MFEGGSICQHSDRDSLQSGVMGVLTGLTRTLSRWICDVANEHIFRFSIILPSSIPLRNSSRLIRASQFR